MIGRSFGLEILHHIFPLDGNQAQLPVYLDDLTKAVILSALTTDPDLTYIFKHVITQEVSYGLLLYAQKQPLHQAVANWYERTFQDDLAAHYPILVHHWRNAGDMEKAMDYLEKAAGEALRQNANQEAVRFLEELLVLNEQMGQSRSLLQVAGWQRQLGEGYLRLGLVHESLAYYEESVRLLGFPAAKTQMRVAISLLRQIGRQVGYRLWPKWFLGEEVEGETAVALSEGARAYKDIALINYFNNNLPAFLHGLIYALNLAERAQAMRELAECYANMCVVAGTVPQLNLAPVYEPKAIGVAEEVADSAVWGSVLVRLATYKTTTGQWADAHHFVEQAIIHYERINDPRALGDTLNILGALHQLEGQFAESVTAYHRLHTVAQKYNNLQHEAWGLAGQARGMAQLGRLEKALIMIEAALAMSQAGDVQAFNDLALQALLTLRLGRVAEAVAVADEALRLMEGSAPSAFAVHPYSYLAMVYLTAWEVAADYPHLTRRRLMTKSKQVVKVLRRFAVGRPAALWAKGRWACLRGHKGRAQKLWQQGLAAAQQQGMPYEEGLLCYEIGCHLPMGEPARQEYLERARGIYGRLQAAYDLAQVDAEIDRYAAHSRRAS